MAASAPASNTICLPFALILMLITACSDTAERSQVEDSSIPDAPAIQVNRKVDARTTRHQQTADETHPAERKPESDMYETLRQRMVDRQLAGRDIVDPRVLAVVRQIPRHKFVPDNIQNLAYDDSPQPIGHRQTISQPYIVALMTQLANPQPVHKALDIGTGSGYQAAVLGRLVKQVYSIEIVEPLANEAKLRLQEMGYDNIEVRHGDGYRGWANESPFDIIIVAAAPDHIPQALVDQLAIGGKMVIPVGTSYQDLIVIEKQQDGKITRKNVAPVRFVPMTGEAQK